jgi:UDP-galactopyranose mutase
MTHFTEDRAASALPASVNSFSRPDDSAQSPFHSFWMGGFEAAGHINEYGTRVNMLAATQHDRYLSEDFALVRRVGIGTVRESAQWHLIDRDGVLDFSTLAPVAEAAQAAGVQVLWTLCHYGWPDDLDLFSDELVARFAAYCEATARFLASYSDTPPLYAPMNELSFFSWACGDEGLFHPYVRDRGVELKRHLARAVIAACRAILRADPRACLCHIEPIINVFPPRDRPDLVEEAAAFHELQFAAWDLISGRQSPEIGGHPRYLDLIGVNFYYDNQWEYLGKRLRWTDVPRDARWVPVRELLANVWRRYRRPLFVAETSNFGVGRVPWLREMAAEVRVAIDRGVPVQGLCLYPIIDRPSWHDPSHWHNSGLWDLIPDETGRLQRVLFEEYAAELVAARVLLPNQQTESRVDGPNRPIEPTS